MSTNSIVLNATIPENKIRKEEISKPHFVELAMIEYKNKNSREYVLTHEQEFYEFDTLAEAKSFIKSIKLRKENEYGDEAYIYELSDSSKADIDERYNCIDSYAPPIFYTVSAATNDIIDEFDKYYEAVEALKEYEENDKIDEVYEDDFYDIINGDKKSVYLFGNEAEPAE